MNVDPATQASLKRIYMWALLVRLVLAVVVHLFVHEELFAPDQVAYHYIGGSLASYWSGESPTYHPKISSPGPKAYYYIVAIVYLVFGMQFLLPKLLNAFIGAQLVKLIFELALGITGNTAIALRASRFTAFFPSLILWSILMIRDVWVVFLIMLVSREALRLHERFTVRSLAILSLSILAIVQFRDYILFAVTLPVVLSFFVRNRKNLVRNTVIGMLASAAVIYADQSAGSDRKLRVLDLEQLHEIRYWHTVGASSGFEQADISTPTKALLFLPKGLAFFMLAPFPWMLGSIRQLLAIPETLFFYSLIIPMIRGIRILLREHLSTSLMVILMTVGMTFGYALGEGNAGTAYRHRAQMLPFYLLFAAVGIEARRAARAVQPMPAYAPRVPGRPLAS